MYEGPREANFIAVTGEDVNAYTPGGFHPLLIGDELKDGRYKIIHKLGDGGSATVWLARDTHQDRYVAIKVLQALSSKFAKEVGIHNYLSKDPDFACASIAKIRNHFTIRGINGRHICLVLDVYGPSLGDLYRIKFRPDHARDIARQITEAIEFLHRNDIAFGDLCPDNILLDCVDFGSFSTEALYEILGTPQDEEVACVAKDTSVARHAPKWIYSAVNLASRDLSLLKPRIVLADLNEAEHVTGPATEFRTGYHPGYASPEFIFGISRRHTKPSDVWILALIFYRIRCRDTICYGLHGPEKGSSIQDLIGPPPRDFYEKAKQTAEKRLSDTDDLCCITEEEFANSEDTIKHKLQAVGDWEPWHTMTRDERRLYIQSYLSDQPQGENFDIESKLDTGAPPPARLSEEEFTDFHDLLSRMLRWNPEERLTIEQVLAHPWLHKRYNDLDEPSDHWIERYNTGRTDWEPSKYDTKYWDDLLAEACGESPCPSHPVTEVLEQASDLANDDEYFVTRLLGLPIPKQEEAEETEVIPTLGLKAQPEVVEKEEEVSVNDEYFVTRLLGLPIPSPGNARDVDVVTVQDWEVQQNLAKTDEKSSDNDEYFVTRLLGLPVPEQEDVEDVEAIAAQDLDAHQEVTKKDEDPSDNHKYFITDGLPVPKQEEVEGTEVTPIQDSKEQPETVKEDPETAKEEEESTDTDDFFVTRLLGLPAPAQEDVADTETIATEHSLVSIDDDLGQPRTPGNNDEYLVTRLLGLPVPQSRDVEDVGVKDVSD